MSFPKMDFPREKVSSANCFIDQELISATHAHGVATEFLPKVAETYGKIIFPHLVICSTVPNLFLIRLVLSTPSKELYTLNTWVLLVA